MIEYTSANVMKWTRLGMRKAFGDILKQVAAEHDDIVVIVADVASSAELEDFSKEYPGRFYNVGIAEQNMLAVAAGLAKEGCNVFVVSFAPFVALRAFEVMRTVVGYMHLNVKIVALASGFSLGTQGVSHYCMEDLALLRTIPGMMVLSPADCVEMAKCIEYLATYDGPSYLRLTGIDGSPAVHQEGYEFSIGSNNVLRDGSDVAIISTGSIVSECMRASRALKRDGVECAVINIHTIKPFVYDNIDKACRSVKLIVTVEEGTIMGGLGGCIAEHLSEMTDHAPLLRIGIDDMFPEAGDYAYVQKECGLTAPLIRDKILKKYNELH